LGSLDRALREKLMNDLRAILKRVGVTAIYVTHDQEEAFAIADRVLIMRARLEAGEGGRVEQAGKPQEIYRQPATPYVARFLGFSNLLEGTVVDVCADPAETGFTVLTPLGKLLAHSAARRFEPGERVLLLVRPEAAEMRPASASGPNVVTGDLLSCSFRGSYSLVRTEHGEGITLTFKISALDVVPVATGEAISAWLDPMAMTLLAP
jgi:ABC-type Fe3+/spermidine/putrescine transport system ATPase subunit